MFRHGRGAAADAVTSAVRETLDGLKRTQYGNATGEGVRVAIFDSWPLLPPPRDVIRRARRSHRAHRPLARIAGFLADRYDGSIAVPLLEDAATGQLVAEDHIYNYVDGVHQGTRQTPRLDCDGTLVEAIDIADHGLFVAGIIKDIAPRAELYLYRVLPDRGCADIHDLVSALHDAARQLRRGKDGHRPVIFNLSLGFAPDPLVVRDAIADTLAGDLFLDGDLTRLRQRLEERVSEVYQRAGVPLDHGRTAAVIEAETATLLERNLLRAEPLPPEKQSPGGRTRYFELDGELRVIQKVFSLLMEEDILIVAAAGNDSCPNRPRARPRIPAMIEGVLGVSAAATLDGTLQGYSNADDWLNPPDDGVAALGGGVQAHDSSDGLYGLAVSEWVPAGTGDGARNTTGLVRWSGTSFATPVAAGFAACLWSEMYSADSNGRRRYVPADEVLQAVVRDPSGAGERPAVPLAQQP